jgi:hypothetical protein
MWGSKRKKLAVALTCADWRLHQHKVDLNRRIAKLLKVGRVDQISVPGPDGLIEAGREAEWKTAVGQVSLMIREHAPEALIVLAHQRCAGHPVIDPAHETDVAATAKRLKEATGFAGPVHAAVAVYHSDSAWDLKPIAEY